MTTNLIDVQNSDVIMCTNNMAENHPVGFQWVMKAKERGAKVIHVDPRFTRTSAVSDIHVPLRSGTNIAFFGGLMSYAIQNNLYFKDYVVYYTNASFLIDPAFKTPTDLGGLFEGLEQTGKGGTDPHVAETYNKSSWKYQLDGEGNPKRDLTLKDPNSVFQLLKRHYSRYTPEMVERICGIPKAKFVEVAKLYCGTSGREKTGTITYALNLTQHTNGVQNIRALCMLQLLLGNIGRPGGGVTALRGHANVQGATDLEVLYHELPGYMAMPLRDAHPDLKTYLDKETPKAGFWVNKPKFFVSLLKAFYGDAATKDNEFGYQWLPKRASADAYSHQHTFVDMYMGKVKKVVDFGAIVEILPGIDGLVHVSQLSDTYIKKVSDVVKEGDEILVKVLDVEPNGRIRLSRKAAVKDTKGKTEDV
jgi:formate dehydrogenase major subunit